MANMRPRKFRASNEAHYAKLYPADTSNGWVFVRMVSTRDGEKHVAEGVWRPLVDQFGQFAGYQVLRSFRTDDDLTTANDSGRSQASIRAREMEMVAGLRGKSRTMGRAEDWRLSRPRMPNGHIPPPEDAIERATAKFRVYPFVGAAKGEVARVWPR